MIWRQIFRRASAISMIIAILLVTIGCNEDNVSLSYQKFEEGNRLYNNNDYDGAIKLYSEATRLNPNLFEAYACRARVYFDLKQYDNAISDYDREIFARISNLKKTGATIKDLVGLYNNRGMTYSYMNQYEKAIEDFEKAIAIDSEVPQLYLNCGNVYYHLKQYGRAIQNYNKCIQLTPNDYEVLIMRGKCYQALDNEEEAHADFDKVKELGYK